MTIWRGIHSHTTDVDSTPGISTWQANTRMRKELELQRRWGYLSSAIAQQTGPIKYIVAAHGLGNNFVTIGSGSGNVDGFGDGAGDPWPPPPDAPKRRRPRGDGGEPQAPVIVSITPSPASGSPWIVGQVTFTAVVTYDGLSGPLVWLWSGNNAGPAVAQPVTTNANPGIFDFDLNCIPGDYTGFLLGVSTTNDPLLSDSMSFDYTVG